ncbi:MAG TPA: ACT domain-containing protein, partial [Solirubrobacteraceae bacterium]
RDDTEHTGRALLQEHLHKAGLPAQKMSGSPLLADVIREMGFRKAEDFYIALGGAKISPKVVVNKVLSRLKQGEGVEDETELTAADELISKRAPRRRPDSTSSAYGIQVDGIEDVPLRLAKCCRPVSGDPIVGYVSLGRGITIHREDCPNAVALRKDPDRFVGVSWEGDNETSFKVELQVDAWDRHRLLEDLSRTFAEAGINILEARCIVSHPMVRNRFVVEVGDTQGLKAAINRLRAIDAVFDAYRVTPNGA